MYGRGVKLQESLRHAIFDLDGVLLDTEPIYTRVIQSIVAPYGHTYDWTVKSHCMGRGMRDAVAYLIETYDLPLTADRFIDLYLQRLEQELPSADPVPFAEAFTRSLHDRGVPMAIVTSTPTHQMPVKIERHRDWFSCFHPIVCGDHPRVKRNKPAPDAYLVAASELLAEPSSCVVFEDAPSGVVAAHAAGMQVVALADPHLSASLFAAADLTIGTFADPALADFLAGFLADLTPFH